MAPRRCAAAAALVNADLLSDTIESRHEDLFRIRSDG